MSGEAPIPGSHTYMTMKPMTAAAMSACGRVVKEISVLIFLEKH